jgi:hypothetical protein
LKEAIGPNITGDHRQRLPTAGGGDETDSLPLIREFGGIAAEGRQRQPCRADLDQLPAVHGSLVNERLKEDKSGSANQRDPVGQRRQGGI